MTLAFFWGGGAFCSAMEISLSGLLFWCFHLEFLWAAGIFQHQRTALPKAKTAKAKGWTPSSSSSLASPFTWVPTPNMDKSDPEGSEAAVAFLYSGDTLRLSQANCTQRFEVREVGKASGPPLALRSSLRSAIETLAHATNFLNMVFQTNDIRESSVKEDVEWYHALVRSVMEGDSQVYRAMLTFDAQPVSSKPQLMLQATKENNEILLQDLSGDAETLRNLTWENEWYNFFRFQKAPVLFKRILNNDLKTLDTPKWSRGDSYVMDTDHIKWSAPFLECEDGKFLSDWMVTLSSSFYGLKPDLKPEFKGVVRMDVKIRNIDINQCASGQGWFANTHQCDLNSTKCVLQENQGFILGRYLCSCKPGFYRPSQPFYSSSSNGQSGKSSSQYASQYGTMDSGSLLECRPCQEGCTTCVDDMPCLIKEDWSLRAAILAFQAFCMLAVFLSMLISYHFRKSKRIRASGVILLETILFGSLLLYFPVFILYFKPSIFRCIVLRWVRMLGFAIVYGTITLKLYRVLKVFLSRTAQRVPYMTSGRVLKMLALILLLVLWFLAAWTVGMLENIEKNIPLVVRSQTTNGLQFYICDHDRWDYMMVVAEMLFLFWGSFLCHATRTVPSAFHEPRYMGIALHNELIISATFHVVRFLMVPSLHPDWTLLLFFIHTHITTTLTLALLFIPKFLHVGSPLREEIAAEVYEDELDMRRSGSYLNSSITSAWSEHSLDPDDIRDELKKLYTQLEVHKTKKMTANNPHLQKKRSSKRGIGRSLMRRITELPESMSRQCSKEEKAGSARRGSGSRSGSYKRRPLDSGASSMKLKDDFSSKRKVAPSLKKSHSAYDHMRDAKEDNLPARHDSCKEAPLLDSLMRKKLAKKVSERSSSDSLDDSAPLVYKSASAHNLSVDKKPLHPKPSPLQKSLSVATSAKEKALLLTSRAQLEERGGQPQGSAAEDSAAESEASGHTTITDVASNPELKQRWRDDTSEATAESLLEGSSSIKEATSSAEAISASTTAPSTPSESRMQKHVTYAPNRSYSEHTSISVGKRHQAGKKTPPEPPVRQQSLDHSLERRDPTLALTPSLNKDSQGSPANVHLCELMESPAKSETERSQRAAEDTPHPSPFGLQRLASIAAEVCPWEVMELPSKKDPRESERDSPNDSPEKQPDQTCIPKSSMKSLSRAIKAFNQSRIKASMRGRKGSEECLRTHEKPKLGEIVSLSVGGSPREQETARSPEERRTKGPNLPHPWGEADIPTSPQEKSPSNAFEVCPWEMSPDSITLSRASGSEAMAPEITGKISPVVVEETKTQWESTWRSLDTDQNAEDKTSRYALMVPRTDKKKAAAYPWEVAEAVASSKSDGQSWEASTASPRDEPINGGYKKGGSLRETLRSVSQEKVSSQHGSRDGKDIRKSPELSELGQNKSKSMESNKAEICPWETEEVSPSDKALICPWEVEEPPVEMSPLEDTDVFPKENGRTQRAMAMKKIGHHVSDSICPWESMELPSKTDDAKSSATRRTSEVGANIRIVICPWETSDAASLMDQPDPNLGEESRGAETTKPRRLVSEVSDVPLRKWDKEDSCRDSVCPWENMGAEEPRTEIAAKIPDLPKDILKTSSSMESKKAEVCPWETEDIELGSNAAICPWEVTLASSDRRTSVHDRSGVSKRAGDIVATSPEMVSSPRESICPWETMDTHNIPSETDAKSPDPSKVACKEFSTADSIKAEVCPWEIQEISSTKADVCPWEEPESLLNKRLSLIGDFERDRTTPSKETGPLKASSSRESVCPWETVDPGEVFIKQPELSKVPSKKSESVESLRAEICPWEVTTSPPDKSALSTSDQDSRCSTPKLMEKLSSPREEVCPWESMEVEEPSRSGGQSPVSRKSDSIESLRAVVCPWETSEEDLSMVDVHPLTAEKAPSEKEKLRHDPVETPKEKTDRELRSYGAKKAGGEIAFRKIEKSKSNQETVCAWGSMDFEKPLAKSTRSLDLFLVCPWEFQESHAKDEIGPCEEQEGPSTSDTLRKDKGRRSTDDTSTRPLGWWKTMEKGDSPHESISPWDSIELLSSRSPDQSKAGSSKSDSVESLRAEVCPWEVEEEGPDGKMPPSKTEPVLITKVILKQDRRKALKGKRLSTSPDWKDTGGPSVSRRIEKARSHQELAYKSTEELSIKQSSKSFDLSKGGSSQNDSTESLRTEVCPWESQEFELITKTEEFPWEQADIPLEKKLSRKGVSRTPLRDTKAAKKGPGGTTKVLASSCSAISLISESDSSESRRTDICPWEAESPELSVKEEICPWETGTGLVTETKKQTTSTEKTEMPPDGEETPQSKPEGLARHRPLCRTYPESTLSKGIGKGRGPWATEAAKTGSDSAVASICSWDTPATIRRDFVAINKAFSEACLPGAGEHGSIPARGQKRKKRQAREMKSPRQAKLVACPWDSD